jgi:EAL domain-containing protein (putative c-di-GMP-specific phosphodiesterase class I)
MKTCFEKKLYLISKIIANFNPFKEELLFVNINLSTQKYKKQKLILSILHLTKLKILKIKL